MKKSLIVLCSSFAFSWAALAGAQAAGPDSHARLSAQSGYGQSGSQAGSTQSGGATSPSQSEKKSGSRSSSSRTVTLTGCLTQGSTPGSYLLMNVTEGSESGSGKSSQQGEASGMSSQAGSSTGTSGQSGSGSSSGSQSGMSGSGSSMSSGAETNMSFELMGRSAELKKYVGQRVEVRGRVEPMSGPSSKSGSSSGSSGMSGQSGSGSSTSGTGGQSGAGSSSSGSMSGESAVMHRVRVSSVRQVGSSCK